MVSAPDGDLKTELYNKGGNPSYKYYYPTPENSKYKCMT